MTTTTTTPTTQSPTALPQYPLHGHSPDPAEQAFPEPLRSLRVVPTTPEAWKAYWAFVKALRAQKALDVTEKATVDAVYREGKRLGLASHAAKPQGQTQPTQSPTAPVKRQGRRPTTVASRQKLPSGKRVLVSWQFIPTTGGTGKRVSHKAVASSPEAYTGVEAALSVLRDQAKAEGIEAGTLRVTVKDYLNMSSWVAAYDVASGQQRATQTGTLKALRAKVAHPAPKAAPKAKANPFQGQPKGEAAKPQPTAAAVLAPKAKAAPSEKGDAKQHLADAFTAMQMAMESIGKAIQAL